MHFRKFKNRLKEQSVVTAAILSLVCCQTASAEVAPGGARSNDNLTKSPIKHVVVIIGENRTFDHVFATYVPKAGQAIDNLLSKGIVTIDGAPGPHYSLSTQYRATDTTQYSIAPAKLGPYDQTTHQMQPAGTSYAFKAPYGKADGGWQQAAWDGPGPLNSTDYRLPDLAKIEYALPAEYLNLMYTGATGVDPGSPDIRIKDNANLPNGAYPLVDKNGKSLYDTFAGSPVHRFFQMWQQFDCDQSHISANAPVGCLNDLFSWVEQSVAAGSNGKPPKTLKEGDIAMGFYNVAKGDAPYFTSLARKFVLADNYHQPVMGGTYANFMMLGYADALYYADANGDPATPPANVIENPNPWADQTLAGADNWYTNDGYSGGSYVSCADTTQPGVKPITDYLNAIKVKPNCDKGVYYLVNNFAPAYTGFGEYNPPAPLAAFTLPPVRKQRHIGDALTAKGVSWAYFGERWNDFKVAPSGAWAAYPDPKLAAAYLYCNICNPFLYSASTMSDAKARTEHNYDITDFYDAIEDGQIPAVSYVKASLFTDGHPASSKLNLFEGFTQKIIQKIQANEELWDNTAILITFDEGGGYYDSGFVQPVDFFGDGTRIPLLVVSKYSQGGQVSHEYGDHASIVKFIERNWSLPTLSSRSRDNLPNPVQAASSYAPSNMPAIGDLWSMFRFGRSERSDD
ncbi:phosphoesterase [Methylocystis sp. MJC1]|uniref:alkaline phosphatase family protein n=1 Tax=Methylocystis sp. MJC1 TaxID=2654282 RepID=UPI0013E9DEA6|nr:alkaline phosphatase family protein [Methylocystis sp. MJC1]KAF2990114.1 Phospholipase C 2 [Methylocystis sp. MJC1]MBU6527630.1 phosphoesterase [Methylocystis sp. MJC1]UZX10571.1 phosphoesterase [Methylocystis sp. MJC1]